MKKYFFSITALLLMSIYAYSQVNFDNQVLVYFKTGVQRVPPSYTTSSISSQNVISVLNSYNIPTSNVIPSFPSFSEADTVNAELGEASRQMNRAKVFTITVTNPSTKSNLIASLNSLSEVLYAESNGTISNNIIPLDGRFGQQWNMRNTIVPGADIHLDGATNIFTGNPNAIIAIIDDGVDRVHNDLDTKILGGDNGFVISTDPLNPTRQWSHGSHVAGIAAAISNNNNNNGVAGVDWLARIHPKNIFDGNGDPDITTSIIDAVNFNPNVWTFNNSWGTRNPDGSPGRYSVTIRSAFAQAYRNNRVSCIAMGNHQGAFPGVPAFPASINSGVIAVGATDINDNVTGFSANGPHIDVSAPGNIIWSTNFNNNYIDLSGTSMATPHVAGLASLLRGFNTALANDDIEQIIRLSTDDLLPIGFDNASGTGRINAERALQFLQAPNTIQQLSATGGTVFSTSGNMTRIFLGVPGLADAAYIVRRSEVRTNVTFPAMCNIIGVWGRGVGTTGFREENGRNFGEGICEVVPGTLTNTGCTLRTWVYEVWSASGQYIGFRPAAPANVVFQYTILGVPAPTQINGEDNICTTSNNYSIPNLLAGATVIWSVTPNGIVTVNSPNSNQTTLTSIGNGIITLTATISNACGNQIVLTKQNISVGIPQIEMVNFTNAVGGQGFWCSTHTNNLFSIEPSYLNSFPPYEVRLLNYPSMTVFRTNNWANTGTDPFGYVPPGWYIFQLRTSNACGTSPWFETEIEYVDCFSYEGGGENFRIIASPNPTDGELNVTTDKEKAEVKTLSKTERVTYQLYDFNRTIIVKQWSFDNSQNRRTLNVSGLKAGQYILVVTKGKYRQSTQILIK